MAFTKLFAEILDSTIWRETNETRLVWITMLAMADKHGDVMASVPGLADRSRVTLQECETALDCLMAPDPYSRTTDFEGRRIATIDGGWHLLNHAKYRRKMNEEERREYNRVKQAERRARLKAEEKRCQTLSNVVNDSKRASAMSAHTEAEAEAEAGKCVSVPREGPPTEDDCVAYALTIGQGVTAEWRESYARTFYSVWAERDWRPQAGHNLAKNSKWKHRLRGDMETAVRNKEHLKNNGNQGKTRNSSGAGQAPGHRGKERLPGHSDGISIPTD